jgi:hypothetical protein
MNRKPNIIEAIRNPKLFGSLPRFKKLDTWAAWLVVSKATFGHFIRITATGGVKPIKASRANFQFTSALGGQSMCHP